MAENTLFQLINGAAGRLAASGDTARLDAELLLAFTLRQTRAWLRAHGDEPVAPEAVESFNQLVERRRQGEPVAYLVGRREFWSLDLAVRTGVLIPRPDTETLVQAALEVGGDAGTVADLGTGTGAVALALATERPQWSLVATDVDPVAVELARSNARTLGLSDRVIVFGTSGDWFNALANLRFDLIVSNPPYIAEHDTHLDQGDVRFEPRTALVSGIDGLVDIGAIIASARDYLNDDGWLLLEHGFDQAERVAALLHAAGFRAVRHWQDLSGHIRVTGGQQ